MWSIVEQPKTPVYNLIENSSEQKLSSPPPFPPKPSLASLNGVPIEEGAFTEGVRTGGLVFCHHILVVPALLGRAPLHFSARTALQVPRYIYP